MRAIVLILISLVVLNPVVAQTLEVNATAEAEVKEQYNYLQEVDLTFWQTAPFAVFWLYNLDGWIAVAGHPHWEAILVGATVVSFVNASIHAKDVKDYERTGQYH